MRATQIRDCRRNRSYSLHARAALVANQACADASRSRDDLSATIDISFLSQSALSCGKELRAKGEGLSRKGQKQSVTNGSLFLTFCSLPFALCCLPLLLSDPTPDFRNRSFFSSHQHSNAIYPRS